MRREKIARVILAVETFVLLTFMTGSLSFATELEEIQTAIRARGHHWIAGETSISRLSLEEKRMRVGLIKPTHTEGAPVLSTQESEPRTGLPASLDWRSNGGNFVTPVRNQGGCGSCWAFAATAALESALLRSGVSASGLDKSEQVLVSCGNAGSCAGGYIGSASEFIRNTGLPAETCYPYTGADGTCSNACANWQSSASKINSWSWVTTTSTTVDALKNGLNSFGPLVTTMSVYADFFNYTSGVYSYVSGSYQGGHAVLLVGYDEPGQYFIVKNSWGTGWGEAGYFRIAYSEVNSVANFGDWTIAYYPLSADTSAPTITGFIIPSAATSLTVSITTFTATDNVGVSGYMLTESATVPSASASGWSATAPTTYTFTSAGLKTLYAWAKDAAGNVSAGVSRSVTITLSDTNSPTVTGFIIPSAATSLTVSITTFTATDNVGVSGYMLTESATVPSASASGWSATAPTTYTFTSAGLKTLYAWAKDAAGNVSAGVSDTVTITLPTPPGPDILWRNIATGQNGVWYMNGVTFAGGVLLNTLGDLNWTIVGVGDFNADGKPDILWRNIATGQNGVWYMNGVTFAGGVLLNTLGDLNWTIVGVGDFNADGKPDILWRNIATGQIAVWYMNGVTFAGGVLLNTLGDLNWTIVGVGDFNADGKPDILWRNIATGQIAVWYMNGVTFAGGVLLNTLGDLNWTIVGVGDFNADGKPDILWRNIATGQNAVWYMNGVTFAGGVLLNMLGDLNWKTAGTY